MVVVDAADLGLDDELLHEAAQHLVAGLRRREVAEGAVEVLEILHDEVRVAGVHHRVGAERAPERTQLGRAGEQEIDLVEAVLAGAGLVAGGDGGLDHQVGEGADREGVVLAAAPGGRRQVVELHERGAGDAVGVDGAGLAHAVAAELEADLALEVVLADLRAPGGVLAGRGLGGGVGLADAPTHGAAGGLGAGGRVGGGTRGGREVPGAVGGRGTAAVAGAAVLALGGVGELLAVNLEQLILLDEAARAQQHEAEGGETEGGDAKGKSGMQHDQNLLRKWAEALWTNSRKRRIRSSLSLSQSQGIPLATYNLFRSI